MTDHAKTIREALLAAKDAWFSGRIFDDGEIHVHMGMDEFSELGADGVPALDALLAGHAAEVEQLRQEALDLAESRNEALADVEVIEADLVEARADAETLRQAWRLDPCDLFGDSNCGCDGCGCAVTLSACVRHLFDGLSLDHVSGGEDAVRVVRAALAAAQEPPADATDCWGEDVRLDSSECEPRAKGDDQNDLGGSDV